MFHLPATVVENFDSKMLHEKIQQCNHDTQFFQDWKKRKKISALVCKKYFTRPSVNRTFFDITKFLLCLEIKTSKIKNSC